MSEQDDDKKIIDGENPSSDNENQPSVDDNNQPEGVENQKNDTSQEDEENNQSLTQENQSNELHAARLCRISNFNQCAR